MNEWAQQARMFDRDKPFQPSEMLQSSLFGPFVTYQENEVLWIQSMFLMTSFRRFEMDKRSSLLCLPAIDKEYKFWSSAGLARFTDFSDFPMFLDFSSNFEIDFMKIPSESQTLDLYSGACTIKPFTIVIK